MRVLALVLIALPSALGAVGIGFTAVNRFPVAEIGNARFEVIARGGRVTAQSYWCAAGDYGISRGLRGNTRVYLAEAEGPSVSNPGRKAVQFTLDPQSAGVTPIEPRLSLSVRVPGDNMTLTAARQFCGGAFLAF